MIEVGQIYYNPKINKTLVITFVDELDCSWITSEGKVCVDKKSWIEKSCELIGEYKLWQQAVNSWKFNGLKGE